MIEITELTYTYPRAAAPALRSFSAVFPRGQITAVTGDNGCGKTTLSKLIVGILRPETGQISIDRENTAGLSLFDIGQRVGYIWQNPNRQLFTASAEEEIAFGLNNKGLSSEIIAAQVERYLEVLYLSGRREAHPLTMSLGEKQRLALAAVLALGAPYLVLDEPTGGLDVRSRRRLGALLHELAERQDCGVIVISHERDFVRRYANREVVMRR